MKYFLGKQKDHFSTNRFAQKRFYVQPLHRHKSSHAEWAQGKACNGKQWAFRQAYLNAAAVVGSSCWVSLDRDHDHDHDSMRKSRYHRRNPDQWRH